MGDGAPVPTVASSASEAFTNPLPSESLDWTVFHTLNSSLRGNDGGQDAAVAFNAVAIFVLVATAGLLWFIARPGGSPRPKIAAASAGAAAALGLLGNVLLGQFWYHARPFVGHPHRTLLLVQHAADNSFPSDHASVAFAIAFAVMAVYRHFGVALLLAATAIAIDRIFVGVHYPLDVAASVLVGLLAALLVTIAGRGIIVWMVERLSKLSDPVVGAVRTTVSHNA
jgi:undecaprenyl-diphosphatase